ncbi:MAG: SDR family oxidoreductase [Myxococcaceae bacterium]|nr:SDR family oxidoreductase [Myxococcaceae bacterium]
MSGLRGEVVLVTGASGAIGAAIAVELAERGADLALLYHRTRGKAEAAAVLARGLGVRAEVFQVDLSRPTLPEGFAAQVTAALGAPTRVVLSAGASEGEFALYMEPERVMSLLELNFRGAVLVAQAFLPAMVKARRGSLVAVTSEAAVHALPMMGAYAASKAALTAWVRTLAAEVGQRGVRANAVAPGLVDADGMAASVPAAQRDAMLRTTPLGRLVTPQEVARAVLFLLDDAHSSGVTGQVLSVDGGRSA